MLPFLKLKQSPVAGLIMKNRAPDEHESKEEDKDDEQPDESDDSSAAIESCARDLIRAVKADDIKGVAEAIQSAFEILDSEPHVEGEHISPHSYEAQNKKAGDQD